MFARGSPDFSRDIRIWNLGEKSRIRVNLRKFIVFHCCLLDVCVFLAEYTFHNASRMFSAFLSRILAILVISDVSTSSFTFSTRFSAVRVVFHSHASSTKKGACMTSTAISLPKCVLTRCRGACWNSGALFTQTFFKKQNINKSKRVLDAGGCARGGSARKLGPCTAEEAFDCH